VEACTPYPVTGEELSGTIAEIGTDRQAAVAVSCNPANTTQAKEGNYTGSCDAVETGDAAGRGHVSVLLLVCALGVAMFGFEGM